MAKKSKLSYLVVTHDSVILLDNECEVTGSLDLAGEIGGTKIESLISGEALSEIDSLLQGKKGKLVVESDGIARAVRSSKWKGSIEVKFPSRGGRKVRREAAGRDLPAGLLDLARNTATKRVRESFQSWDRLVVQAVSSIEEHDRSMANLYAHCREWYGLHFPELERIIKNERLFSEVIIAWDPRSGEDPPGEPELSGDRIRKIQRAVDDTSAGGLNQADLEAVREIAKSIVYLDERKTKILEYLTRIMGEQAPSLTRVAEAGIGARLIARAGSIRKLALMPSTSVQTLGAEKALFRHITKGAKPPKHGIIFQHPLVRNSPKQIRGKVSSALASRISLAARADYIKGENMGEELRSSLDSTVKRLRQEAG